MGHCIHIYNYIQGLYGTLYSYIIIIIYRVYMGHCIHIYIYIIIYRVYMGHCIHIYIYIIILPSSVHVVIKFQGEMKSRGGYSTPYKTLTQFIILYYLL